MTLIDISPYTFYGTVAALAVSLGLNLWLYMSTIPAETRLQDTRQARLEGLPDGWYTNSERFHAERRAIFSQTWICLSHRNRFEKAGDYVVYEVAGFRLFMILGKDNVVRSFHNVCRHRAFPVARKASGSATILGCRYHGWSYNTKGQLTKAPYFEGLPGFDKAQNSLFEILTKEDSNGFLHINVSTNKLAAESNPPGAERIGMPARINQGGRFLHSWESKGKFNWKVALNDSTKQFVPDIRETTSTKELPGRNLTPRGQLRYNPLTTVYTQAGRPYWYLITLSPISVEETTLRCDVYTTLKTDSFKFEGIAKTNLEQEVEAMTQSFVAAHKHFTSLNNSQGSLNSLETKTAYAVASHLKDEYLNGAEIKPALVNQNFKTPEFTKAEQICQALECGSSDTRLAW